MMATKKSAKKHDDAAMDKSMMQKMLKSHANKPASKAHKGLAEGGMVARGGGAARKSSLRFTRNG
jgi:hypothetical protein